jgi:putative Holliday junction resolvase
MKPFERIAGIDYGTVRIGIAVADTETQIASPVDNYTRRSVAADGEYFVRLAKEERLSKFVVGLPIHLDGHESQKSQEARKFGDWLGKITRVPVEYFDERFTSAEAEQFLLDAGLSKQQRKQRLDKLAAQIMLTAYLEANDQAGSPPQSIDH